MVTQNYYMPGKAAQMLGVSEDEVLELIKHGKLKADYLHNVASYMIAHDSIVAYLKKTKNFKTMQNVMTQRILLVDRDPDFQDLIRMEVTRNSNAEVKIATSDRDVGIFVQEFVPDLILIHLAATQRATDKISDSIRKAKERKDCYLIVYHNYAPDVANNPEIQGAIKASGADEAVSIYTGARLLLQAIFRKLGRK